MKYKILLLFLFFAPYLYSQSLDCIEDYYSLCNSNKLESELILQNSVFMLNGRLVEDINNGPFGYFYFYNKNGEEDSILFFNRCNYMVFQKNEHSYFVECLKSNGMFEGGETEQFKHLIKLRFFCYDNKLEKYFTYTALFPISWMINYNELSFFCTTVRITSLKHDNYLMSISTYGRYWDFHIVSKNNKSIKRKLVRKHKKTYGQF